MVSSMDGTSNFSYDATNQLTGVDNSSLIDEAYSYDANGNRTNSGYQTGVNNQLLSDGKFNYQYDGEGNRTKRTEIATGKVTEYNWDYRNRLTAVAFKDAAGVVTKSIEYTYDVDNQRIGKKIDGAVTERYVIDRNQIALVFDGAGTQTHRYLYGTNIDQVLADETPTNMVWALADHQGTVRDLIDNGGNVVEHLSYDSFGNLSSTPTFDFRYGYTGRERDSETGLEYYRARYYDSAVGRFVSEDPIGFAAGDSNLTRYVGNSPTNFVDPSGLEGLIWGESGFNPLAPILPLVEGVGSEIGAAIKGAGAVLDKILVPPVGNGELPRGYQGKQRGNFGEFDPNNYWRKTKPATIPTFTNTGGKTQNFDPTNYFGFPNGPDACSISRLGGFNTGHGKQESEFIPFLRSDGISGPREEDVTDGPHGPYRDIIDVVSRARQTNSQTGKPNGPQGRWLSEEAGRKAVANLDIEKMKPNAAYSVPIYQNEGVVVRPYNTYPKTDVPASQRYILDPADRAIVIRKPDGIHTFPIGAEHPAYSKQAPTK
jgi:RHS repeat-associated protein